MRVARPRPSNGPGGSAGPQQRARRDPHQRGAADGAPFITLFVDPWKSAVIEIRDPRDFNTGESIAAWQHALHAGHGLGWVWKLLVFISGIATTLFAITGTWMWLAKRLQRRRVQAATQPSPAE